MKTKQLIERALPFSHKYIYLDIVRGSIESGQVCTCDNCGKLITNMVHIFCKETGKHHSIGTDCAETFSLAKCLFNNGQSTDFYLDIYAYNKVARFVTELRKGIKMETDGVMRCHLTTDKGKTLDCWINELKKWFPEFLPQLS